MAKLAARKGSLFLEDAAGASQVMSANVSSITLTFSAEATELTGFGNDNRERAADGIRDWELSMDGFWNSSASTTDEVLSGIRAAGGSTSFKFGPAGSINGCPMYTACGVLTSYDCNFTAEDSAQISFTIAARSGSLTRRTVWP